MGKPLLHETSRLNYVGAVDADGHILEPPDLWETYLEPRYRDRALRIVVNDDGLEALEIGGRPSVMSRRGSVSVLGAMGDPDLRSMQLDPERTYLTEAPYGSMDPTSASSSSTPRASTPRSSTPPSGSSGRPSSTTPSSARPTPGPTTAGSASSAPGTTGWSPPPIGR